MPKSRSTENQSEQISVSGLLHAESVLAAASSLGFRVCVGLSSSPQIRGTFLGAPSMRIVVLGSPYFEKVPNIRQAIPRPLSLLAVTLFDQGSITTAAVARPYNSFSFLPQSGEQVWYFSTRLRAWFRRVFL